MSSIYKINNENFVSYEILEDFIIIKFLFFDDVNTIDKCAKEYIDHFISLGINFLGQYPGTTNPIIIDSFFRVLSKYNLKYRIFYDFEEVKNTRNFETKILKPYVAKALSIQREIASESSCGGIIGKESAADGFKFCCFFSQLNNLSQNIKLPMKYYKVEEDGTLSQEYDTDPNDGKKYYKSIRLKNMFQKYRIVIENGQPKYFPKDK